MTPSAARGLSPTRVVLGNGVVVLAKRTTTTPAVTIHASFTAGTIFDPLGHAGTAQFVARTIDRGTPTRTADDIAEALDRRGVSLSVSVNRHALAIVCTCLVEDLQAVLDIVADVSMAASYPESEVETRRSELITLVRQDEDNPASVASERLMTALYGKSHPYGRRPRGSVESLQRTTAETLRRFHRDRFRPTTLSLALVGDVEPDAAVAAAERSFGAWSAPPAAGLELSEPAPATARRVEVVPMMNKAQADIAYGFISIQRSDPAYCSYWLMNNILGQYSIGGRLGTSIRDKQGMAYYVQSGLDANVIAGPLVIRAGVAGANVERTLASIDEELRLMVANGPTDEELRESRQYLIGSMPRTLETNGGIAMFLQTIEFFGLGLDYDVRVPGMLATITRDDVHQAARRTLDPSRAAAVVAGPFDGLLQ